MNLTNKNKYSYYRNLMKHGEYILRFIFRLNMLLLFVSSSLYKLSKICNNDEVRNRNMKKKGSINDIIFPDFQTCFDIKIYSIF